MTLEIILDWAEPPSASHDLVDLGYGVHSSVLNLTVSPQYGPDCADKCVFAESLA